jgi:isoleucyl-tRNA synthetase
VQTKLVKLSAKPNFLAIKAKGPDYAKNMKVISAKLNSLTVDEIKALQNGDNHARRKSRPCLHGHDRAAAVGARRAQPFCFTTVKA